MKDSGTSLKLGVIGCGRVAETRHLPVLQSLPNVEVVAVADLSSERLQRVAEHFSIAHRYADFRDLLNDPAIEAVAVCVPAQFHVPVAVAALDAEKHLLIEKPLALSLDECDQLIARASRSPHKVMVGFNMRWHRLILQAREMIKSGAVGPVNSIRTAFTSAIRSRRHLPEWRNRRESGGGALFEIAVHHFDLWRFLLQSEVEEVFAICRAGEFDDEVATVTAQMANGVLATSIFSERTSDDNEVEIYGRAGRLRVSCYRFDGLQLYTTSSLPGDIRNRLWQTAGILKELPRLAMNAHRGGEWLASYRTEWRQFIASIRHNTPVQCTLDDGRRALHIALAALESAAWGQPVKLAQAPRKVTPVGEDGNLARERA